MRRNHFRNITLFLLVCPLFMFAQTNTNTNRDGHTVIYHTNGRVASEGMMRDGKPDGFWRSYYPTGVKYTEGNRVNFLMDSTWVLYTVAGDTSEIINYMLGKRSGFSFVFETITERNNASRHYLKSKEMYLENRREGLAYYYYPSGKLRQTINFRNNRRQGSGRIFDENGTVITLEEYRNGDLVERQHINRMNNQGERHGVWKTFYPSGMLKEEEYYKNGTLDGESNFYSERGNRINRIFYSDGNIIEEGIPLMAEVIDLTSYWEDGRTIRRKGRYLDSIPVNFHFFYNREGKPESSIRYSLNGTGISTGEGPVDEDENRTGEWKLYFETGELRANGRYANDRQHGEWHYYSQDGKKFQTGNFNMGRREGKWMWFFPSGEIFREETLMRDQLHGLCIQYSDSATIVAKGEYVEDERNGFWIEHIGDIREEGNYIMGDKDGMWRAYHRDGQLYHAGNFVQGSPDGRHLIYYPDGTLKEEQHYVMGRRYRNWRKYFENGELFLTITYNDDREIRINGIRVDR